MSHQIRASLADLRGLAAALKDLQWYTGEGGYRIASVAAEGETATWTLETRPPEPEVRPGAGKAGAAVQPGRTSGIARRVVEPGDQVVVETKGQQMSRRFGGAPADGVEGTVFRVLTRGPHPHGMKVELRDGTVGRVKKNLTAPGAGEP